MPRDWHYGHATSIMSSSLDLLTCSTPTPSRPSLNPFYGRPLEMEYVADETLLGFALSTSQRTITFRQPPHLTLIRSNRTAGSPEMALAGFFTRGILICRLTRPRDLILPQLADLTPRQRLYYGSTPTPSSSTLPSLSFTTTRTSRPISVSQFLLMQHLRPIFAWKILLAPTLLSNINALTVFSTTISCCSFPFSDLLRFCFSLSFSAQTCAPHPHLDLLPGLCHSRPPQTLSLLSRRNSTSSSSHFAYWWI